MWRHGGDVHLSPVSSGLIFTSQSLTNTSSVAGGMGIPSHPSTATSWTAGTMVLLLSATADFSVAPVVYTIVSEIPSTRLRAKSIILARNAYNIINLAFVNIISYRQFNPSAWNWGPKSCFFWAGINLLMNIYLYYRLRKCTPIVTRDISNSVGRI